MDRNRRLQAIILKKYPIGDSHDGIILLTEKEGLQSTIAHGARSAKGRLRGQVPLFASGIFDIYTNPVKKSNKIIDIQLLTEYPGIRESIEKFYTASLWAEIALKTHAGGQAAAFVFSLMESGLALLDICADDQVRSLSIHYLLHWLEGVGGIAEPETRNLPSEIRSCLDDFLHSELYDFTKHQLHIANQRKILGWCYHMIEAELETHLNTLKTGAGIIV